MLSKSSKQYGMPRSHAHSTVDEYNYKI